MLKILENRTIYGFNERGEGLFLNEALQEKGVPFTLPLEIVDVEISKSKHAFLKEIKTSSPLRRTPECPYFTRCGGCVLLHLNEDLYKEFKKSQVQKALTNEGLDPFICEDPILLKAGGRRRANLDIVKKEAGFFMGFHRLKSHQIINIESCWVLSPPLNEVLLSLRPVLNEVLTMGQKAKLFLLESDTGIDLALEIFFVSTLDPSQRAILSTYAKEANLSRLFFRHRKTRDIIYQANPIHSMFDGVAVEVDAYSFLQSSKKGEEILTCLIMNHIKDTPCRIADLFSGYGTFSFPLSSLAPVDAYESDPKACTFLKKAISESSRSITVKERDLFQNPLNAEDMSQYDVIVIDPPRAGALEQITHIKGVQNVIYVSCNPLTFARDARILCERGYTLTKVIPVDQFVGSSHVELVGVFQLA